MKAIKKIMLSLISIGLLVNSAGAHATAIANSNLDFFNLQMTPESGTLELLIDWEVEAFAQAQNSLGELDQDFDSSFFGGDVSADASVTWADGHGEASTPDFFPPDLSISGSASSNVNIPGCGDKAASSLGRSLFINGFSVTGGTGLVNVDFSAQLEGALEVWTDFCGKLAETEVIFTFEIFDFLPPISGIDQDQILWSFSDFLSIGINDHKTSTVSESLFTSRSLEFDTEYFFVIEVDSESRAIVAEPSILVLVLAGLLALFRQSRKNRMFG